MLPVVEREEIHVIEDKLNAGDPVRIVQSPLQGLEAVVSRPLPARERVAMLLDFPGRQTYVEVSAEDIAPDADPRRSI